LVAFIGVNCADSHCDRAATKSRIDFGVTPDLSALNGLNVLNDWNPRRARRRASVGLRMK